MGCPIFGRPWGGLLAAAQLAKTGVQQQATKVTALVLVDQASLGATVKLVIVAPQVQMGKSVSTEDPPWVQRLSGVHVLALRAAVVQIVKTRYPVLVMEVEIQYKKCVLITAM